MLLSLFEFSDSIPPWLPWLSMEEVLVESLRSLIYHVYRILVEMLLDDLHAFYRSGEFLRWSPYFFLLLYRALLIVHLLITTHLFKFLVQVASKLSMYIMVNSHVILDRIALFYIHIFMIPLSKLLSAFFSMSVSFCFTNSLSSLSVRSLKNVLAGCG